MRTVMDVAAEMLEPPLADTLLIESMTSDSGATTSHRRPKRCVTDVCGSAFGSRERDLLDPSDETTMIMMKRVMTKSNSTTNHTRRHKALTHHRQLSLLSSSSDFTITTRSTSH